MMTNTILIQQGQSGFQLNRPVSIIIARQADEVVPALQAIETAVNQHGLYAAGFLCYEAAAAYDLAVHDPLSEVPLLWFGLYEQATPIHDWPAWITQTACRPVGAVSDWHPAINLAD